MVATFLQYGYKKTVLQCKKKYRAIIKPKNNHQVLLRHGFDNRLRGTPPSR